MIAVAWGLEQALAELVGTTTSSPELEITADRLALICSLTWATSPLHASKPAMARGQFGERLFPGPVLPAIAAELFRAGPGFRELQSRGIEFVDTRSVAIAYRRPVLAGDRVTASTTLTAWTPQRPVHRAGSDRADVEPPTLALHDALRNQRDELVADIDRVVTIRSVVVARADATRASE